MFHFNNQNSKNSHNFEGLFYLGLLTCLSCFMLLFVGNASAAVNPGIKTEKNSTQILKSNISDLAHRERAVLDWQTQDYELTFDLPEDSRYQRLDLLLTAIPDGNVSTTTPVTVSYNGEKPIPLYAQGSRFDAQIELDPARIRTSRNSIKFSYPTPHQTQCLTPENGKWILDFSRSQLTTTSRQKSRPMKISEIERRLQHPLSAPKRIAIRALGSDKTAIEALSAQGIANRLPILPAFQFTANNAEFQILVGTRENLKNHVNDQTTLADSANNVFMDSGQKLILTSDTEIGLLDLARAFAERRLPNTRRTSISTHEFLASPLLRPHAVLKEGKHRLGVLGDTTIRSGWNPAPTTIEFNIADPVHSAGLLTLDIGFGGDTQTGSKLKVRMNGESIGYTKLDKSGKFVTFDIKPGMFKAAGNKLEIQPVYGLNTSADTCADGKTPPPSLSVSGNSTLKITGGKSEANLGSFAATGGLENTAIVLTARSVKDRVASLRFLAFAAQQFGPGLARAEILSEVPMHSDKNLLIIGPAALSNPTLLAAAPSAVKLALKGKPATGPNTQRLATIERYASSSHDLIAVSGGVNRYTKNARIGSGGIAAMFVSPYANDKMVTVITSTSASKFPSAMKQITTLGYWNGLQGSVSRWNKETILMAQTATPLPKATANKTAAISWMGEKLDFTWMQAQTEKPSFWQAVLILSLLSMIYTSLPASFKSSQN